MMELVKKNIRMNRFKSSTSTQVTMDDDFIVPDTMDDMEQVILSSGNIVIESVKNQGERVLIKGKLAFQVLYRKAEGGLQTLAGSIPLEEPVNVPELGERDDISVSWEIEDLTAGMINSRKLSIKAIVTLNVRVEALCDGEAAVDVEMNGETAETLKRTIDVAAIAVRRKDTYRIKEDISLSSSKPSIERVLWSEMQLMGASTKPLDGQVHVEGELAIFLIYTGEGENTPIQWLEESIPFAGDVDLPESVEGMVPSIALRLVHKDLESKPDYDGEMRDLEVDAVLELDMKLYEEQPLELLSDLYATDREVVLQRGEVCFDRLLSKNTGKCKISDRIQMEPSERILQICHNDAAIKIDNVEIREDALNIDGALEVSLLYMTSDDTEPVKASTAVLPFQYTADASGIQEDSVYQLNTGVEQMTAVMAGGDMVEIRAVLNLDILVLQPTSESVIINAREEPLNLEKLQALPGIVGYIVQHGDSLWDVAKRFHTTISRVMETNDLTDDQIRPGDRLLLVKEVAKA
ncbi:MAG: DUF3794 domain-containing protein [Hungatella sp.]|nr:DUF3794 domain-containing protein [Hungatella sp.]